MIKRQVRQIHLGDGRFLDSREVCLELLRESSDSENEMATVARLSFAVSRAETSELVEMGLIEPEAVPDAEAVKLEFRTDRDLLDEEDESLEEEWEATQEDPGSVLGVWCDLDYWELVSIS